MQLENPSVETQANGRQKRDGSQARRQGTKRSTNKGSGRQGAIILTMSNPTYHY